MNDNSWKILSQVNEWVRFSEGKAIALMAAQGVLLGVSSNVLLDDNISFSSLEVTLCTIAIIFNALSIFFAFLCLNPRLNLKGGVSPLYFGSIASDFSNSSEYHKFYKKKMGNEESIEEEVCGQIFVNSQIANRKFINVAYSIRLLLISLFFWFCISLISLL